RPHGEMHPMRSRQLLRDLEPGVASPYDQNGSFGYVTRIPVPGAVSLEHPWCELAGEFRYDRSLEWACRDNHLVGFDAPVSQIDAEPALIRLDRPDGAPELDGEIEGLRVLLQVRDHLVPRRIAGGISRKGKAREAVVPAWGEEEERVPAITPGSSHRVRGIDDQEALALRREEMADGEARLARPDHDHVVSRSSPAG